MTGRYDQRRTLYRFKMQYLSRAIELAPDRVRVTDLTLLDRGIVGVWLRGVGGLHAPLAYLSPTAFRLVCAKLAEVSLPDESATA